MEYTILTLLIIYLILVNTRLVKRGIECIIREIVIPIMRIKIKNNNKKYKRSNE